jgi:Uncharacterized protein containing a von Willebrand factor type A (vWA) domain
MGLLDFLFGNKNNNHHQQQQGQSAQPIQSTQSTNTGSSLNMSKEQAVSKLNMRKETMSKLCMTKKELGTVRARVAVAFDYSGSMEKWYKRGVVQDIMEKLLPIGLKFDDNGELDMWLFDDHFKRLPSVTEDNFYEYINREVIIKGYDMGGTNYAPVMKDIYNRYAKDEPLDYPSLVLFITDGDNYDKDQAERMIREASKKNIFWQFVGVGNGNFDFLEMLDEMEGRFVDNANFFPIKDIHNMSDEDLYEKLLFEYPSWEKLAKGKGLIK